jgi:hypothetical protein
MQLFSERIVCAAFMYFGCDTITVSIFVKPIPAK